LGTRYKYLFRLGRGKRAIDLLGPSIAYFWNDIYDAFDIKREMLVEKLDGKIFSIREIKRISNELFEDMEEDSAVIWVEVESEGYNLDEMEKLVITYVLISDKRDMLLDSPELRVIAFDEGTLAFLVHLEDYEKTSVSAEIVQKLLPYIGSSNAKKVVMVTNNPLSDDASKLLEEKKVIVMDSLQMLRKINEDTLNLALDNFRIGCLMKNAKSFSKERFRILLEMVKNASSNVSKKNTLESLAEYLFNNLKGFKVLEKDYRGPSEEIDLLVANESQDPVFRDIGNPIAVECRHRKNQQAAKISEISEENLRI
jgi:hypothetical protein